MLKRLACLLVGLPSFLAASTCPVEARDCPVAADGILTFADRSIGIAGDLAVDTDGAAASYSGGDHGFSSIVEGVDRLDAGKIVGCSRRAHRARCRSDWAAAEKSDFGPSTPQFCSFAISVAPWREGQKLTKCSKGLVIGNGLGRPRIGAAYPAAAGGSVHPYDSETSLHQWTDGQVRSVDLGTVPAVVVPKDKAYLVGAVAWVSFGKVASFAVAADAGPAYHEGSSALHQILHNTQGRQPIGPIPTEQRCPGSRTRGEVSVRRDTRHC